MTFTVGLADEIPAIRSHPAVPGDFVTVSVGDTGTGLAPDVLDRIFEPFFTTKSVGQGTGLGLSQVFGFTKQSGGDVIVRNSDADGAVFTMYLPAAAAALEMPTDIPVDAAPTIGEGARVLVVEDNSEERGRLQVAGRHLRFVPGRSDRRDGNLEVRPPSSPRFSDGIRHQAARLRTEELRHVS